MAKISGQIAFISLQDLKGSIYFGDGPYDKLKWVADLNWDLLVIDEAHEGVDTFKTDKVFNRLQRKWTLHLSGTPFRHWPLINSLRSKSTHGLMKMNKKPSKVGLKTVITRRPLQPSLILHFHQLSSAMTDKVNRGTQVNEEEIPYYFDLNEFFAVNDSGKFLYEADVIKFLDTPDSQ